MSAAYVIAPFSTVDWNPYAMTDFFFTPISADIAWKNDLGLEI